MTDPLTAIYLVPMVVVLAIYLGLRRRSHREGLALRQASAEEGMTEPATLHPVVDPARCIGSGSCVRSCPERTVLRVVDGKAELVDPGHCIGHGACMSACPVDAITLVFGTETRGVDIPMVEPNFETNIGGIFIAGELGGMGLIRNAIEQGRQAIESIRKVDGNGDDSTYDVIIVGAGPAGFSATLAAQEHGLRYQTIEQDTLGGAVAHYPRNKVVMTAPAHLPLVGKVKIAETTKEALLEFWQQVERQTQVKISYKERAERITKVGHVFEIETSRGSYRTRTVLLAIGRRGTPRKLEVPGEDLSKVVYRLIDPEQYRHQKVLVVGGGDSALEAATSIAEEPGTTVTLSYRGDGFNRAKAKNRRKVQAAESDGRLQVLLRSNVLTIASDHVDLDHDGQPLRIANDAVLICAGGVLPTSFLEQTGIAVETKHGTR